MHACAGFSLPPRRLRGGKEFSAFDLAISVPFDAGKRLQAAHKNVPPSEPEEEILSALDALSLDAGVRQQAAHMDVPPCEPEQDTPASDAPSREVGAPGPDIDASDDIHPPPPPTLPAPRPKTHHRALTKAERDKLSYRARRRDKRTHAAQLAASDPKTAPGHPTLKALKAVALRRQKEGRAAYIETHIDAQGLPHTGPAWTGLPSADGAHIDDQPARPYAGETGMGTVPTQAQIDCLVGAPGFTYIAWQGLWVPPSPSPAELTPSFPSLSIPIIDARRRVIALLGGRPRGKEWDDAMDDAARTMDALQPSIGLPASRLHHRRAQTKFKAVARGVSHGGGQTVRSSTPFRTSRPYISRRSPASSS
jgi:hypothetical protein